MTPTLIGLCGVAQSGKDTVAHILYNLYNFNRVAFADALKELAYDSLPAIRMSVDAVGWEETKRIPAHRRYLQDLGVGVRDVLGPDTWVNTAFAKVVSTGKPVVFTDVRFPNEWDRIKTHVDAVIVKVVRPGIEPPNAHISETAISDRTPDYILHNDGTVVELSHEVIEMFEYFAGKETRLATSTGS